ncbi:MAG: IS30 family transposase [Oscillospiraceae bacterium]|jgi:IS30 family transposase|nr:IS30 family transposase [Oscillospiraceae bacterium]
MGNTIFSVQTLYSYIDKGVFLALTSRDLPHDGKKKQKYHHVRAAKISRGESIERRPEAVQSRDDFVHWEMDCVMGKISTKRTLLVLTERKTRFEIILPMKSKKASCVVRSLDGLERRWGRLFRLIFKTITIDNGSEFSNFKGLYSLP